MWFPVFGKICLLFPKGVFRAVRADQILKAEDLSLEMQSTKLLHLLLWATEHLSFICGLNLVICLESAD